MAQTVSLFVSLVMLIGSMALYQGFGVSVTVAFAFIYFLVDYQRRIGKVLSARFFTYSLLFLLCFVVQDVTAHVIMYTWLMYLGYVLSFFTYLFFTCHSCSASVKYIVPVFTFYILTNFICWVQMSGMIPSWACYSHDFYGLLSCYIAGLPFFIKQLFWTVFVYWFVKSLSGFYSSRSRLSALSSFSY